MKGQLFEQSIHRENPDLWYKPNQTNQTKPNQTTKAEKCFYLQWIFQEVQYQASSTAIQYYLTSFILLKHFLHTRRYGPFKWQLFILKGMAHLSKSISYILEGMVRLSNSWLYILECTVRHYSCYLVAGVVGAGQCFKDSWELCFRKQTLNILFAEQPLPGSGAGKQLDEGFAWNSGPKWHLHGVSDLTDVTLVSQDDILLPSYQTMETIFLTLGDSDVDTMTSATNTKVNTREFSK